MVKKLLKLKIKLNADGKKGEACNRVRAGGVGVVLAFWSQSTPKNQKAVILSKMTFCLAFELLIF